MFLLVRSFTREEPRAKGGYNTDRFGPSSSAIGLIGEPTRLVMGSLGVQDPWAWVGGAMRDYQALLGSTGSSWGGSFRAARKDRKNARILQSMTSGISLILGL